MCVSHTRVLGCVGCSWLPVDGGSCFGGDILISSKLKVAIYFQKYSLFQMLKASCV